MVRFVQYGGKEEGCMMNRKKCRIGGAAVHLSKARKELRSDCWLNAADLFFELGSWVKAKEYYLKVRRYARASPMIVWAYYQLGRCSENLGDIQEADAMYKHGMDLLNGFSATDLAEKLPGHHGGDVKAFWRGRFAFRSDGLSR